jgi:hypothetical protein
MQHSTSSGQIRLSLTNIFSRLYDLYIGQKYPSVTKFTESNLPGDIAYGRCEKPVALLSSLGFRLVYLTDGPLSTRYKMCTETQLIIAGGDTKII